MNVFIFYGNKLDENSKSSKLVHNLESHLNSNKKINKVFLRSMDNTQFDFMSNWKEVISYEMNSEKKVVKDEIMKSDIIIIISPVYLHNVSAYTKLFLDNFASWSHTMPLIGKIGMAISLSSDNGNKYVDEYLTKIMNYWGILTLPSVSICLSNMQELAISSYLRFIEEEIVNAEENMDNLVNVHQEKMYKMNQSILHEYPEIHPERIEFEKNGGFEFQTFREALINRKNHRNKYTK